jgi:hypothetical protein
VRAEVPDGKVLDIVKVVPGDVAPVYLRNREEMHFIRKSLEGAGVCH